MVSPATRREWVRWVIGAYRLSERRASRATGVSLRRPSELLDLIAEPADRYSLEGGERTSNRVEQM